MNCTTSLHYLLGHKVGEKGDRITIICSIGTMVELPVDTLTMSSPTKVQPLIVGGKDALEQVVQELLSPPGGASSRAHKSRDHGQSNNKCKVEGMYW